MVAAVGTAVPLAQVVRLKGILPLADKPGDGMKLPTLPELVSKYPADLRRDITHAHADRQLMLLLTAHPDLMTQFMLIAGAGTGA